MTQDNFIDDTEEQIIHPNEYRTSLGEEIADTINYELPTKDYFITDVLDDVVMGEIYNPNVNEKGEIISAGGIIIGRADKTENLYEVMKVTRVGGNVKEVKVGEYVVVSKTGGMKIVEFDGRECAMLRESGIFMKVKPKK